MTQNRFWFHFVGSDVDPVSCFELYLSKLNSKRDDLWQKPKSKLTGYENEWYKNAVIRRDPLNDAMKSLSDKAKLSCIYTNHCIRATTVTNLNEKGFEARDITATTGHKSETSIKSYASRCPDNKHRKMSDALAETMFEDTHTEQQEQAVTTEKEKFTVPTDDFPELEIPDNQIVDILTQIEKDNEHLFKQPNDIDSFQKQQNVLNVSNVSNVANVSKANMPQPPMYFSHSTITINYNYYGGK